MKCLKYFLHRALGLLVGLFPILALADEFKWSHMVGVFTPPATDRSMAFLAQIFGGVGSGLAAGGSTIMGEIFGVFNAGLLVVTGVVLTYITIRSITDTAMDGEAMGKKLSHWTAVRVALSVVILVPGPSGYSLINSVVMWFTVQGVGFADTIWSHSLDYLKNGGVIYRQVLNTNRPEVASGLLDQILVIGDKKPSATTTSVSPSQNKAGASDIFRSMVCMHVLDRNIGAMREKVEKDINDDVNRVNKYYPKDQQKRDELLRYVRTNLNLHPDTSGSVFTPNPRDPQHGTVTATVSIPGDGLYYKKTDKEKFIYFLGSSESGDSERFLRGCCSTMVGDDHDCSSCYTKTSTADPIGLCGKYTVNFNGSDTEGDVAKVDYDTYITVKYAGLTALVNELDATAQDFVIYNADRKVPGCDSKSVVGCFPQDRLNSSASSVVSGAGVYQAAIEPARIICSNAAATQHCDFNVSLLEEIPAVLQPDGTYACKAGYSLVEKMCKRESGDPSSKRKFIDDIKTQGWLSAGSYYFDVAQLNENQIKWDNTNYKISFAMNGQPPFVSDSGGTTEGSFSQVTKYMKDNLAFSSIDPDFTKEIDMKVFPGGNSMITDFKNRLWVVTGLAGSYSPTTKPEFLGVEPQAYKFMNDITETLRSSTKSGDVKAPFIFSDASITPNLSTSLVGVPNDVICGLVPVGTLICALGLNKSGDSLVFGPMMTSLSAIYYSWGKNLRASTDFPLIRLHNFGSDVLKSVVECFDGIFSGIRSWLKVFFWKEIAMNIIGIVLVGLQIHGSFWGVGPSWRLDAIVQYMNNIYNALFSVIFLLPLLMTLPMALSVMMPLFMIGITLAYYIPLIPFMLFTFGTITWLIFVVEAMAAAPLIALGLTHPEGHDLLGKAEQALLLLFSVFLRPAGMVIGLIASLILSYVALNVLNYGFDQVMVKIGGMMNFGGHAILVAYFKSVIGVVLLMIYVLIVMALMNQCFAMIHLIPEKFSRWIGGHPEVGADVQMLESVKGGIAPFAEAGRAAGETTGKLAGGVGEFMPTKTRYTDVKPESKEEGPAFRPK